MATVLEQQRNASVAHLIDTITSVASVDTLRVLSKYGFGDEFKYGINPALEDKILTQLYYNDENRFWSIINEIKVDTSKINPTDRMAYQEVVGFSANQKGDWWKSLLGKLQGSTTESTGGETITQTSTGAYIAYIFIVLAIIGITWYLIKSK